IVAGSDGYRSLERIVHLEIVAGLLVVVVDENRVSRSWIARHHSVIHRNRLGRTPWDDGLELLEDGTANDGLLERPTTWGVRVRGRDAYSDLSLEVTVLDCE